jgi:tumor protein p53-inducible protein 3
MTASESTPGAGKHPDTMRAVLVREAGDPSVLEIGTTPMPVPAPGEVLVRVHATALNRADLMQRQGKYPPPRGASPILGLEMAGEVIAAAGDAQTLAPGDRVCALLAGGGYAEYVAVPEELCMSIPGDMTYEEAAAVPEVFLTAFQALHWLARLEEGDTVLVHAGASGVGTAAIQLARAGGAAVIVTASSGKHDLCLDLGALHAIDYKTEDFAERVLELTDGRGADVIVDFIGAPYLDGNIKAIATDGRLVLLAMMGGSRVEGLDLKNLFRKRVSILASTLRNRSATYKAALTADFAVYAMPLMADGRLKPVIDSIVGVSDVREAHARMEANENAGKIVMRLDFEDS